MGRIHSLFRMLKFCKFHQRTKYQTHDLSMLTLAGPWEDVLPLSGWNILSSLRNSGADVTEGCALPTDKLSFKSCLHFLLLSSLDKPWEKIKGRG